MSRLYSFLALALLLVPPALAQTGTAQFFVPLRGGEASGVAVTVYSEDPNAPSYSAVSDESGLAVVENVPDGRYYAFATEASGYLTIFSVPSEVSAQSSSPGFALISEPDPAYGVVRGQLTDDETGEPVRFNVLLVTEQGQAATGIIPALAAVDGDGNYAFQIEPGSYDAAYNLINDFGVSESFRPGLSSFSVAAGETVVRDVALERRIPGTVTGVVTDAASGAPVTGAVVQIYAADNTFLAVTVTGADGVFTAEVPENDYIVFVDSQLDGYIPQFYQDALFFEDATLVTVPGDGTASGIDFSLSRPAADFAVTFTGRLVDSDGQPVQNGTVSVYSQRFPFSSLRDVRAGADGTFTVESNSVELAGSRLSLGFQAIGYVEEFFDDKPAPFLADFFDVGAEAVTFDVGDVELLVEGEDIDGLAISGTITSDTSGQPLAGAIVAVTRVDQAESPRYAISDAAGAYRVDGLEEGRYAVLFTSEGHIPEFFPDAVRWSEGEKIDLTSDRPGVNALLGGLNRPVGAQRKASDASGRLEGIVRDASGESVSGALVTAQDQTGAPVAFSLTDANGRYELVGLDGDLVTLSVDRPRYAPTSAATSTTRNGRLILTLNALSSTAGEASPEASGADLSVFPNPTRDRATVAFSLAQPANVRVAVYDMLGREVSVIAESALPEGTHAAAVDTAAMAPGLYIVRVESASGVSTARFTVVR